MTNTQPSTRRCEAPKCPNPVANGRRRYCSERCAQRVRKARWRAGTTGQITGVPQSVAKLFASQQHQLARLGAVERELGEAQQRLGALTSQRDSLARSLSQARIDAAVLAGIVYQGYVARGLEGYDGAIRSVVERHRQSSLEALTQPTTTNLAQSGHGDGQVTGQTVSQGGGNDRHQSVTNQSEGFHPNGHSDGRVTVQGERIGEGLTDHDRPPNSHIDGQSLRQGGGNQNGHRDGSDQTAGQRG